MFFLNASKLMDEGMFINPERIIVLTIHVL